MLYLQYEKGGIIGRVKQGRIEFLDKNGEVLNYGVMTIKGKTTYVDNKTSKAVNEKVAKNLAKIESALTEAMKYEYNKTKSSWGWKKNNFYKKGINPADAYVNDKSTISSAARTALINNYNSGNERDEDYIWTERNYFGYGFK